MINHGFVLGTRIALASETPAMMTSALFKALSPEAQERANAEIAKVAAEVAESAKPKSMRVDATSTF